MKQIEKQRLCGTRVFTAINCSNKIRKVAQNKFEKVFLCGKHAFNYSVITQNLVDNRMKETIFPNRNEAIAFFALTIKKYNM